MSCSNLGGVSAKKSSWAAPYGLAPKPRIAVVNRDSRCKMITLDPDTAHSNPEVMSRLARDHDGKAGIYGVVLVEGVIRPGEEIALLD